LIFTKKIRYLALILALFIVLIFSSTFVYAGISDLGLEDNHNPISKISLSNTITATVVFYVDNDTKPISIVANFSDFVTNPYYKDNYAHVGIPGNSCNWDNESNAYKCGINNIIINPEDSNIKATFNITFTNYIKEYYEYSKTFEIDDNSPKLENIYTDYCYEGECYLVNGGNRLYFGFDDASENFARRKVHYKFNNIIYPIKYCEAGICTTQFGQQCASGMVFPVSLVTAGNYKSEDDAGNPVESDLNTNLKCDSIIPYTNGLSQSVTYETPNGEVTGESSIQFISNNDYGLIEGGKSLTIKAYVFEDGPILYAKANFTSIGGSDEEVTCTKSNEYQNLFVCDFSVSTLFNEYMQKNLEFEFIDIVNHSKKATKEITIKQGVGSDVATPDCIAINGEDFYPKKINRVALGLAQTNSLNYPTFAPFKLKQVVGSYCKDMIVNEIKIYDCFFETLNGTLLPAFGNFFSDASKIQFPYRGVDEKNYLNVPISVNSNAVYDTNLICNFSIYVSDNEKVYSEPLMKNAEWSIDLINSALGTPGEAYTEKIKDKTKDIESDYGKFLDILDEVYTTAAQLCQVGNTASDLLNKAHVATDVIEQTMSLINVNYDVSQFSKSNAFKGAQITIDGKLIANLLKNQSFTGTIFEMACNIANCPMNEMMDATSKDGSTLSSARNWYYTGGDFGTSQFDGATNEFGTVGEKIGQDLLGNLGTADLKESMLACVSTGCLPCMVYHLEKWRDAECDRLYCLKRQAQYGLSIESCDVALQTFACTTIWGEVFEFPFVRQAKNLLENFNGLAQNFVPQTLTDFVTDKSCTLTYERAIMNPKAKVSDLGLLDVIKCEIPLTIGKYIRNQKLGSKAGSFIYPANEVEICKLALCNEENESNCNVKGGLLGKLPPSVANTIFGRSESAFEEMFRLQKKNRDSISYAATIVEFEKIANTVIEKKGYKEATSSAIAEIRANNRNIKIDYDDFDYEKRYNQLRDELIHNYGWNAASLPENWEKLNQKTKEELANDMAEQIVKVDIQGEQQYNEDELITEPKLTGDIKNLNPTQLQYLTQLDNALDPAKETVQTTTKSQAITKAQQNGATNEQIKNYASQTKDLTAEKKKEIINDCDRKIGEDLCKTLMEKNEEDGKYTDRKKVGWGDYETYKAEDADYQIQKQERAKFDNMRGFAKFGIDIGVSFLWNNYIKDLGTLGDLGRKFKADWLVDFSEGLESSLTSDAWINSLCNPSNRDGAAEKEGWAIDCSGDYCVTVLTMAMERSPYAQNMSRIENPDEYLYTFIYHLGPITDEYGYNIYFKYGQGKRFCVFQNSKGNCKDIIIKPKEEDTYTKSISFVSKNYYEEVCFIFDRPFPSPRAFATEETAQQFCRKVKEDVFATGDPDIDFEMNQLGSGDTSMQGVSEVFG